MDGARRRYIRLCEGCPAAAPGPVWWASLASSCARRVLLPAVVGERLVRLRHAVDVVLALERVALLLLSVQQLVGQALGHRLLAPGAGELDEPAHGQGAGAAGRDLDGHPVGG